LQSRDRLLQIYQQMPEPRFVVAVGSCALSGGAFRGCYNVVGQIDEVIPVDVYIPGCPPRPEAIVDGVVKLLQTLQGGGAETAQDGDEETAVLKAEVEDALNL
jgi:NADH:ubiquinone oxidoreductase subunit B-like Fe-S oxidoreductase